MQLDDVIETNFKPVRPEMTLGDMLHKSVSKSARNIFPVLDEEKKMVGIVLLDDIREFMFDAKIYDTTFVKDLMHAPPEYIFYSEDSMKKVMKKFQESGAWNLPVIKNGKYEGFVSKSKLLTAYRKKLIDHSPLKMKFKHIIVLIVIASFASIIYGFTLKESDEFLANRFIGSGTVGLFLIAMPLFIFKESKGKKMKDYMLTKENIKKMNDKERQKTGNQ